LGLECIDECIFSRRGTIILALLIFEEKKKLFELGKIMLAPVGGDTSAYWTYPI